MMNVLQVLNYSAPYKGNFIKSLEELENNDIISIKNYYVFNEETKFKSSNWLYTLDSKLDTVYFISNNFLKNILFLRKIIISKKISIVHMHFFGIRMHTILKFATIGLNVKIIRHFHNHSDYSVHRIKKGIGNIIYRNSRMIGCSESVSQSIVRDFPFEKKTYVDNAIAFSRLEKYESLESQYTDVTTIMVFGGDFYRKGIDIAYKAIEHLVTTDECKIKLIIICSMMEKECINYILDLAKSAKLPEWIEFLPPREDIATYYHMAKIFISPSREEGFTYAIPEAVYCGCRIVASNINGQNIHKKIPGCVFVSPNDPYELEIGIKKVLNDEIDTEKAKKYVLNEYGIHKWANNIAKIYLEEKPSTNEL